MPRASEANSSPPVKVIICGDSGKGKTGALASLVLAGYSLRCLDFDNGFRVVVNLVKQKNPELLKETYFETLTDTFKNINGRQIAKTPIVAWPKASKLLSSWKTEDYDLGPVTSWGPKDVLVLDSLTHAGYACMRWHQSLNAKLGQNPTLPDWGVVQSIMIDLLSMLYDDEVKCNVVVNTHIDYRFEELKNEKGMVIDRVLRAAYPNAPGSKFPEKVGSFFNDCLKVVSTGTGSAERRKILTMPDDVLGLKTSNPGKVSKEYPIDTGLAQYFEDVRK